MTSLASKTQSIEKMHMDAERHLREFRDLRERGTLCAEGNELFANDAAEAFMAAFDNHGEYLSKAVTLLGEISTLEDPELAEPAHRATFQRLIEPLSDSFDPDYALLYDKVMAQLIDTLRRLPQAAELNAALLRFETGDEASLLLRKARLRDSGRTLTDSAGPAVRKAIVLSRVTLGADVAITSVVLRRMRLTFPNAELCLIGPAKAAELFGGDPTLRFLPVAYPTKGGLFDRLMKWVEIA